MWGFNEILMYNFSSLITRQFQYAPKKSARVYVDMLKTRLLKAVHSSYTIRQPNTVVAGCLMNRKLRTYARYVVSDLGVFAANQCVKKRVT